MDQTFFNPMLAQQTAPAGLTQEQLQQQALLRAMQGLNARQAPATTSSGGVANALAQGLNGYLQGAAMRRQPPQLGPNAAAVESSVVPLPLAGGGA